MHSQTLSPVVPKPISAVRRSRARKQSTRSLQEEYNRLLSGMEQIQRNLDAAQANFNTVYETKAVDVCIYRLKTAQSQYENLLNELRVLRRKIQAPDTE